MDVKDVKKDEPDMTGGSPDVSAKSNKNVVVFAIIAAIIIALVYFATSPAMNKPASSGTSVSSEQYMKTNGLMSVDYAAFDKSYKAMTDIQQKEYLKTLGNPLVEWTGFVHNVTETEVYVGVAGATFRNFDAEVSEDQKSILPTLKKEEKITIRGTLVRRGLLTDWVIRDAKIIK
ncbi:hypothetical protein [Paenibacillus agricola]|uniref:tRNA_anti-like n=1 Tax=Paenibacillus agricola TaxID=2716264 RepID=A0ABX0J7G1_9BACL|nr:hypothetical protein [Paenibacillus agricola]NHN31114.1 hypothetical protein [Paenibacillus agricola]